MMIVDNLLQAREREGRPIRVGMIGAGFMAQGLANTRPQTRQTSRPPRGAAMALRMLSLRSTMQRTASAGQRTIP